MIPDEAQSWPEFFARLRGAIDHERNRTGRFLLLGSVSPSLMTHVAEPLAGRLSLVELTTFLASEFSDRSRRDALWMYGGYPDGGVLSQIGQSLGHSYHTVNNYVDYLEGTFLI